MAIAEEVKSGRMTDWLLFLVFFIICVLMLVYVTEWFWLSLPFVLTYLVKASGAM